jgi:hypothetical protein
MNLSLHMVLNEPQITLELMPWKQRKEETDFLRKYEFVQFAKSDYYCIDGFPTEGMPGVVVLPAPLRSGYIYQGLKPAVIVFNEDNLTDSDLFEDGSKEPLLEHIKSKHLEQQEKLKMKRAASIAPVATIEEPSPVVNIGRVDPNQSSGESSPRFT